MKLTSTVFIIVTLLSTLYLGLFGVNHVYAKSGETGIPDDVRDKAVGSACANDHNPHCTQGIGRDLPETGSDTGIFCSVC